MGAWEGTTVGGEELDAAGAVVARFTHGPGIDEPLAMYRDDETHFYHADGLGSITSLTDDPGGEVKGRYAYDSFGNLTSSTGTLANNFRYTGREFDSETGLYYYRARYYDPEVGRFMSEDPIGFSGGINFYRYVSNNPINFIDPFGLEECLRTPMSKIDERCTDKILARINKQFGLKLTRGDLAVFPDPDAGGQFLKGTLIGGTWNVVATARGLTAEQDIVINPELPFGQGFGDVALPWTSNPLGYPGPIK